uniref:Uncharacterized protein n=1 Tax=Schlesneria paludicola TaxID=360056 RepID=A0A7C4LPN8_9PLAN
MSEPACVPSPFFPGPPTVPLPEAVVAAGTSAPMTVRGRDLRVDPPQSASPHASAPQAATATDTNSTPRTPGRTRLLIQQAIEQLAELEHREELLRQQTEQLDQERIAFRCQQAAQRREILQAEDRLREQQSALDQRQRELDEQARALVAAQRQLETDREHFRSALREELAAERVELVSLRTQLDAERELLEQERARLAAEELRIQEQVDRRLETERQALWENLTEEWERRRAEWNAERAAWENECAVQRQQLTEAQQQLAEQQRQYEQLLQEWQHHRDQRIAELERHLADRRAAWEAEWAAHCARDKQALEKLQHELERERVLLENRLRFQQEHLEKVRHDLERAQADFRLERQRARQQLADDVQQVHRRERQLKTYRQTVDELARTIEREHETVLKCRAAWSAAVDTDRQLLEDERRRWEDERRREQSELQRRHELLLQQHEQLAGKRLRLERLRAELEDTHRTTLELRLAVEETWAQIAQAVGGEDDARLRVEQARQALVLYYQQLHAALDDHRRELAEQQAWLDEQRSEFHAERQTVLHWLNERDERLRAEEARQLAAATDMAARDAAWRAARDQWLAEKLEAERVIRRLVQQLADDAHPDRLESPPPEVLARNPRAA